MNTIEQTFQTKTAQGGKVFIAYITAGDPSLESTVTLVHTLEQNGVDIIELGVPFSDPVADGPVNQDAAYRALQAGTTLNGIIDTVRTIRASSRIPLVLFAYYNTILQYGIERFAADATDAGIDGLLVLDLPPEEAGEYKAIMDEAGLATIFLISPVTPPERIQTIADMASGFVYYVSQMGVTGERSELAASIPEMIARIQAATDVPVAVGFGISTPEQAREAAGYADGIIVGSAIVKRIGASGGNPDYEQDIGAFVATLTEPLRET